jgi:uncharacterized RDD family membrane protein YckC
MDEIIGPVYARRDYAGFIRRTIAFFIDLVLISAAWIGCGVVIAALESVGERKLEAWMRLAFYLIFLAYFVGFRLSASGTPGYRLMRIRYVYMLGPRPTVLTILFRAFASWLLVCMLALDHLWILFDERKQAWHDKITGFYVVKRHAQPAGEARMVQRMINIMGAAFFVWEPTEEQWFADSPPVPASRGG